MLDGITFQILNWVKCTMISSGQSWVYRKYHTYSSISLTSRRWGSGLWGLADEGCHTLYCSHSIKVACCWNVRHNRRVFSSCLILLIKSTDDGHTTDSCNIKVNLSVNKPHTQLPPLSQEIHYDEDQQDPMPGNKSKQDQDIPDSSAPVET
jgi:hypothetical protein